jgi:subtilisin family serine protease
MIDPPTPQAPRADAFWAGLDATKTTGRYVVVFSDEGTDPTETLRGGAGLTNIATSQDFEDSPVDAAQTESAEAIVFNDLGIAVVTAAPSQMASLQTASGSRGTVKSVSPELIHHVLPVDSGYLSGYADGVADLAGRLDPSVTPVNRPDDAHSRERDSQLLADTAHATWGLQAAKVMSSSCSGRGIKVAVLDTGFDATHPDFVGRNITAKSFIAGEPPQDGHGHGTHCVGTSCGPKAPDTRPRYGIAYGADIFAGKVLDNSGSGADSSILAGIDWAVRSGCDVISMSLGADVPQVHPPYVAAGEAALRRGSLIVAAAGNNADRRAGNFGFVGPPANSPAILAIGALEQRLDLAFFSARTLAGNRGGQVDHAAPGWQVYSSWPMPVRYRVISGTSMATPHVAGLAALWAEKTGLRGRELWASLAMESQRLLAPSVDVGGGLPLAPQ